MLEPKVFVLFWLNPNRWGPWDKLLSNGGVICVSLGILDMKKFGTTGVYH